MRFTKMQGAGNDYIYVDCFAEPMPEQPDELARRISDRHFGVGGDGLILICPSQRADARMRMFNADGSEAEMCGNGIRCVAKYVYDHGLCRETTLRIETGRGVLTVELEVRDGVVRRVRVDMGEPILLPELIPTTLPGDPSRAGRGRRQLPAGSPRQEPSGDVRFDGQSALRRVCGEARRPLGVGEAGLEIEIDPHFPNRVNAEFVEVVSPDEVRVRVWERGSGETLACGTGACAVCVAGVLSGRTNRKVLIHLPGGDLDIHWADDNHVYMTGPAVEVFHGDWDDVGPWNDDEDR